MAVDSTRTVTVGFSGDVALPDQPFSAEDNADSSGQIQVVTLSSGANTITAPSVSGVVNTALTIIPPAGNTETITLKGVTGDTGIGLHLTDPTSIALSSSFTSLCLTAGGSIVGLRLIWS